MVDIGRLLVSKYRTILNVVNALHRSAPQDRLRILAVEVDTYWLHGERTQA